MPFEPGKSGNPGGRAKHVLPDGRSLNEVAREHTLEAIKTLVAIMKDGGAPQAARAVCANAILDRGWGKPKQAIDLDVPPDGGLASILQRIDGMTRVVGEGSRSHAIQ